MEPEKLEQFLRLMRQYGATRMTLPDLTIELGPDPSAAGHAAPRAPVPADIEAAMERAGLRMFMKGDQ